VWLLVPDLWKGKLRHSRANLAPSPYYTLLSDRVVFPGREGLYFYYPRLDMHIRELRPDIIHVEQGVHALSYTQALLNKKLYCPQAKCLFFAWAIHRRVKPFWKLVERFNLRNSDYAIAGTQDVVEVLEQKRFSMPIKLLPQLGINPDLYSAREVSALKQELKLEGFVVGYVGRFMEEKGLGVLIEAFSQLEGPRTLVLVGGGEFKNTMVSLTQSLNVDGMVRFVDVIPHEEVPQYMNCFDVMVLPSRTVLPYFKEQFGHVLIEAMACEVPVIGSDSGAIPQVIGDAGLVFHEDDGKELTERLQLLIDNPTLRAELALKGRQRVLERYTHSRIAEETYRVYQELLSGA
jgi:glycosyltransferase involved in cell wall biosynthesis